VPWTWAWFSDRGWERSSFEHEVYLWATLVSTAKWTLAHKKLARGTAAMVEGYPGKVFGRYVVGNLLYSHVQLYK
jgi:hypothetical protein